MDQVTWADAQRFCKAAGLRLPTEAEWEYAARAGTTQARYGDLDQVAWLGSNSQNQTHPVAGKSPNAWQLYDMLGNVWEWVNDWYQEDYYTRKVRRDPPGPAEDTLRITRGGSAVNTPVFVRSSHRRTYVPNFQNPYIGFRCAGDLP